MNHFDVHDATNLRREMLEVGCYDRIRFPTGLAVSALTFRAVGLPAGTSRVTLAVASIVILSALRFSIRVLVFPLSNSRPSRGHSKFG